MFRHKIRQFLNGFSWSHKLASKRIFRQAYLKKSVKQRLSPQNQLSYFVLNILDHCNLKCKGCDHFASVADERFVSADDIKKDLAQMSKILKGDFPRIGVMGGEPLLHPQLKEILISTRLSFPKTLIELLTNGILLLKQDEDFWRICREQNIIIANTRYPINLDYKAMKETAATHGVMFEYGRGTEKFPRYSYKKTLDIEGNQNPTKSFIECFGDNMYPLLMEGKLYGCTIAPNVRHFNKRFGTNMKLEDGDFLDIYSIEKVSELLNFIGNPKPFCRYCDISNRSYGNKWERSRQEMSEWVK
ncbi:MAG: hypothetical protein CVU62_08265 [Deltaproteobacteria bacterium HGW-Deltaproteobacteria-2]|jgi:hypothetical protein|nr:MAG: hypothetical protein CVU62_08265 [Deltaproteobacteria bacterium HGW-Deltaproteobacteria-2]